VVLTAKGKGKGSRSFFKTPSCCRNKHDSACSSSKRPESYRDLLNSLLILLFCINNKSGSTTYLIDRHSQKVAQSHYTKPNTAKPRAVKDFAGRVSRFLDYYASIIIFFYIYILTNQQHTGFCEHA
jgi:hypothetical protein